MAVVEHELLIEASIEQVYRMSQDYSVRGEWDPFPEHVVLLHGATEVVHGARSTVKARNGLRMTYEFVQVAPPFRVAIAMVSGPAFLASFAGSWDFTAQSENITRTRFRYTLTSKPWAVPPVSEPVAVWYFGRSVRARLRGLKAYCERQRA